MKRIAYVVATTPREALQLVTMVGRDTRAEADEQLRQLRAAAPPMRSTPKMYRVYPVTLEVHSA